MSFDLNSFMHSKYYNPNHGINEIRLKTKLISTHWKFWKFMMIKTKDFEFWGFSPSMQQHE